MFDSKSLKNQARYEKAVTSFVGYSKKLFQLSKEYFLLNITNYYGTTEIGTFYFTKIIKRNCNGKY